jgi:hypothetical protein
VVKPSVARVIFLSISSSFVAAVVAGDLFNERLDDNTISVYKSSTNKTFL